LSDTNIDVVNLEVSGICLLSKVTEAFVYIANVDFDVLGIQSNGMQLTLARSDCLVYRVELSVSQVLKATAKLIKLLIDIAQDLINFI
jgi:hypothetical protein